MLLNLRLVVRDRRTFGGGFSLRSMTILRLKDGRHYRVLQVDRNHMQEMLRCSDFSRLEARLDSLEMREAQLDLQPKQAQLFTTAHEAQLDFKGQST